MPSIVPYPTTHAHPTARAHQQYCVPHGIGVHRVAAQVQQDEGGAENEGGLRGIREGGVTGRGRGRGVESQTASGLSHMKVRRFQAVLPRSAYQESAHDDTAAADAATTAAIIVAISHSKHSYICHITVYSGVTVASCAPFHAAAVAAAVAVASGGTSEKQGWQL
jgi:hypothetical protein